MREKEPQFTVTDRRKFTAEGELREGTSESIPQPAVAERQQAASPQPSGKTQAVQAELDEPLAMDEERTRFPSPARRNRHSRTRNTVRPRHAWTTCCGRPIPANRLSRR